jgi:hypothetical protein
MRIKIASDYSDRWLETERPQPLSDNLIETTIQQVLDGNLNKDISNNVYVNFKESMSSWLTHSKLNKITGLENFSRIDIMQGCTQFIDSVYMQGEVQVLKGDYKYHHRLENWGRSVGSLSPTIPLIIAMPFPSNGAVHDQMTEILDEAQDKGISVHVDGAWFTCCRGIDFDVSHPAIKSVGISLSKGLGLGWNRIGLRWTKKENPDSITIMNDFNMLLRAPVMIANHFLSTFEPDYLWKTHGHNYFKICQDFNLTPTPAIHIAMRDNQPVGLSPLLRYLENATN